MERHILLVQCIFLTKDQLFYSYGGIGLIEVIFLLLQQMGSRTSVSCLSISPCTKLVTSGQNDNTISLWDTATQCRRHILFGHTGTLYSYNNITTNYYLINFYVMSVWKLKKSITHVIGFNTSRLLEVCLCS